MKRLRPSPALVISLIALFVALGGTSYAAITSLPANSVGTAQIKNGAVSAPKLSAAVLKSYLRYGITLPSGDTESGAWGGGGLADTNGGGAQDLTVSSFAVPLAKGLDNAHTIFVSGASATHCPGAGHAAAGYLCVYKGDFFDADAPSANSIVSPYGGSGTAATGFGIDLSAADPGSWGVSGTYAVTAP